jgi:hypothetical protein
MMATPGFMAAVINTDDGEHRVSWLRSSTLMMATPSFMAAVINTDDGDAEFHGCGHQH